MEDPFTGVAGHAATLDVLRNQLETGRLPHAYLFVGEPMVGKTVVARALARALLPEVPLERHPDYWEDDRTDSLKLDEIRLLPDRQPDHHQQSLQAFLSMKPAVADYRVALITNVGRLPDPVQGILLKTLEEPHPGRVIILTTPNVSPFIVLPTVASRCQRVSFHGVPQPDVAALLTRQDVPSERSDLLAELSRGRPGWALRAAADESVLERHQRWADRLDEVVGAPPDVALRLAAELDASVWEWRRASRAPQAQERGQERGEERGDDPLGFAVASWQLHLRRRMLDESRPASQATWARLIERSFDTLGYLEQNVSPRLALECFLLEARRAA